MRHVRVLAGALFLLVPALLLAQAQGRVIGTVTDTKGKPIAGAKIIVTCPEIKSFHKELATDSKGTFAILLVDATKRYVFHAEAPGFQAFERDEKPKIGGETLELTFALKSVQELEAEGAQKAMEEPGMKELREGKDLLDAGKKDEARAKFAEAVRFKPELYQGWMMMAKIDLDAGKAADALANAERCLQTASKDVTCLAIAMDAARLKGDKDAYARYEAQYKNANPTDPSIFYNEAVGHLNSNDDAGAKPLLEKTLEIDPNYPDALFQLGMIYVRSGDNAKAKELLQKFLQVAPTHKDAASAKEMLKYL